MDIYSVELDFSEGCNLESIALAIQNQHPHKIVTIIDYTTIHVFEDNTYFPIACNLIHYSAENDGIYHLRGVDSGAHSYVIFGTSRLEKILPDFLDNHPEYNPDTCTFILADKEVLVQKCNKKYKGPMKLQSKTIYLSSSSD